MFLLLFSGLSNNLIVKYTPYLFAKLGYAEETVEVNLVH